MGLDADPHPTTQCSPKPPWGTTRGGGGGGVGRTYGYQNDRVNALTIFIPYKWFATPNPYPFTPSSSPGLNVGTQLVGEGTSSRRLQRHMRYALESG